MDQEKGNLCRIMLYNYVNNSHWIQGTTTIKTLNKIFKDYVHIKNILPIKNIISELHMNHNNNNILKTHVCINKDIQIH